MEEGRTKGERVRDYSVKRPPAYLLVTLSIPLVGVVIVAAALARRETPRRVNATAEDLRHEVIVSQPLEHDRARPRSGIERSYSLVLHPVNPADYSFPQGPQFVPSTDYPADLLDAVLDQMTVILDDKKQLIANLSESELDQKVGGLVTGMCGSVSPSERLAFILNRLRAFDHGKRGAMSAYVALVLINRRARDFEDVMFEVSPSEVIEVLLCAKTIHFSADQPLLRLEAGQAILHYYQAVDDVRFLADHLTREPDAVVKAGTIDAFRKVVTQENATAHEAWSKRDLDDTARHHGVGSDRYLECKAHWEEFNRRREARRRFVQPLLGEVTSVIMDGVVAQVKSSPSPEVISALARFLPDLDRCGPSTASSLWGWMAAQPESVQADFVKNIPSVDDGTDSVLVRIAQQAESSRLVRFAVWTLVWNSAADRQGHVLARLVSEPRVEVRLAAIEAMERAAVSKAIDQILVRRALATLSTSDPSEEARKKAREALETICMSESGK